MNDRQYKDEETQIVKVDKYSSKEIALIHDMYAKNSTKEEFELFLYTANKFGLDPLLKQIWCVKFENKPAMIYAGRDGFLEVAHRSGQFNGIKSGMKDDNTAYAEVYRKDMEYPFYVEVYMSEYSTGMALWKSKPRTMLIKVAESQALRRAFSISNIYGEEEMGQWELQAQGIKFNNEPVKQIEQKQTNDFDWSKLDLDKKPKWEFTADKKPLAPKIIKRLFAISQTANIPSDEFRSLCFNITNKEHSYEWTYGDIKNIEEAIDNFNKPAEPEYVDVEDVSQEELEADYEENIKYFEKKFDAVETPDSVMANLDKKLNVKR